MSVDIGEVLTRGFQRTVARNGLLFVGIFYVVSLLSGLFTTGVDPGGPPGGMDGFGMDSVPAGGMGPSAPSLGLSPGVAALFSLLFGLVSLVVTLAAIRTFVSDETEEIPRAYFSRNLLWAVLNLIVGGIVFGIVVTVGLVLLIVPGLFLLVSFFFWEVYVAVEDEMFVDGFRSSWDLTKGHRLQLFLLGVVFVVVSLIVSFVFGLPALFFPDVVAFLVTELGSAIVSVFFLATVGQTYNQLAADGGGETATGTSDDFQAEGAV